MASGVRGSVENDRSLTVAAPKRPGTRGCVDRAFDKYWFDRSVMPGYRDACRRALPPQAVFHSRVSRLELHFPACYLLPANRSRISATSQFPLQTLKELQCGFRRQRPLKSRICIAIDLFVVACIQLFMKPRRSRLGNRQVHGLGMGKEDRASTDADQRRCDR